MYTTEKSIGVMEKNFFNNSSHVFDNFKEISMKRKQDLDILVSKFLDRMPFFYQNINSSIFTNEYCIYMNTLTFLTNTNRHYHFKTFDEKVYFLISCVDPNCEMYRLNLTFPQTMKASDRATLTRRKRGYYNTDLLNCETFYLNKFSNKLVNKCCVDYSQMFLIKTLLIKNFQGISKERYQEIKEMSNFWNALPNLSHDHLTCIYNVLYQHQLLNLNSTQEQILFFICSMDPNLRLLDIYDDESLKENVADKAYKELGFFYEKLIPLEKDYTNKFQENKKLSKWLH